jgi:uncharacterized Ntn-hydrolase superfamily protein
MTLSIVARTADAGMFGMAIASSSPAVAARCIHVRANVGAVASQNITDPALGPKVLDGLARGLEAGAALDEVLNTTRFGAYRQLIAVGRDGMPAIHTGSRALGVVGSANSAHAAAAGNLLADSDVPAAMIQGFDAATGHLGARLLEALRAGVERGGEAGPLHSAGLVIVRDVSWPIVDLRVDWSDDRPVAQLICLWSLYAGQIDDYVRRALDPQGAPGFGVPGDMK